MLEKIFGQEKEGYYPDISGWDELTAYILILPPIIMFFYFILTKTPINWVAFIIVAIFCLPSMILLEENGITSSKTHPSKLDVKLLKFSHAYIKIMKFPIIGGLFILIFLYIANSLQDISTLQVIIFLLVIIVVLLGIVIYYL